MVMVNLAIGLVLMVASVAAFRWGIPKDGQPSRVPNKWGLGVAFPILVMVGMLAGFILFAKGLFPG